MTHVVCILIITPHPCTPNDPPHRPYTNLHSFSLVSSDGCDTEMQRGFLEQAVLPFGSKLSSTTVASTFKAETRTVTRTVVDRSLYCQRPHTDKRPAPLGHIPSRGYMDTVGIDFAGPFQAVGTPGSQYIGIVVDHHSKFIWVVPTVSTTAADAISVLVEFIEVVGTFPKRVVSDRGSFAISAVWQQVLRLRYVDDTILDCARHNASAGLFPDPNVMASAEVKKANLSKYHVLALMLYTTSSYASINEPLRKTPIEQPHPFAVTLFYISEAIKRLRIVQTETIFPKTYWRGLKDRKLSEAFFKANGGTEYGCMSTSALKEIAFDFAKSSCPLVFKLVVSGALTDGADISFLSVYPLEKEVLYPPLTYLRVKKGKPSLDMVGSKTMLVIEVEPQFPS